MAQTSISLWLQQQDNIKRKRKNYHLTESKFKRVQQQMGNIHIINIIRQNNIGYRNALKINSITHISVINRLHTRHKYNYCFHHVRLHTHTI